MISQPTRRVIDGGMVEATRRNWLAVTITLDPTADDSERWLRQAIQTAGLEGWMPRRKLNGQYRLAN